MAKKTEKLIGEDFNVDPDLDFEGMDFNEFNFDDEVTNDRNPAVDVSKSLVSGAAKTIFSKSFIYDKAKRIFPKYIGDITSAADTSFESIGDITRDSISKLKPATKELATVVDAIVPEDSRFKKISSSIKERVDPSVGNLGGESEEQRAENDLLGKIEGIFGRSVENDKRRALKEDLQIAADKDKFDFQAGLLTSIDSNISKMASYSKVTNNYQKKSLELQFRSYFTQIELLRRTKDFFELSRVQREAIIKNTALPEFVKIKDSERFKEQARSKLINSIQDSLFGKGSMLERGFLRLKKSVEEFTSGITESMSTATQGLTSMQQMLETNAEMNKMGLGVSKAEALGGEVGAWLVNKAADFGIDKYGNKLTKNGDINEQLAKVARYVKNPGAGVDELRETDKWKDYTSRDNIIGKAAKGIDWLIGHFKDTKPDNYLDDSKKAFGANDIVPGMDEKFYRSVTDVIPAYLSKQLSTLTRLVNFTERNHKYEFEENSPAHHAELRARAGDIQDGFVYDYKKASVVRESELGEDILEHIRNQAKTSRLNRTLDNALNTLAGDTKLSPKSRTTLKTFIADVAAEGAGGYTVDEIKSTKAFNKLDKDYKELASHMLEYFNVDKNDKTYNRRRYDLQQPFLEAREAFPSSEKILDGYMTEGHQNLLAKMGLIIEENGSIRPNYESMIKLTNQGITALHIPTKEELEKKENRFKGLFNKNKPKEDEFTGRPTYDDDTSFEEGDDPLSRAIVSIKNRFATSEEDAKEDINKSYESVLPSYRKTDVYSWRYKEGKGDGKYHQGPMAGDINANFGEEFAPKGKYIDLVSMNAAHTEAIKELDKGLRERKGDIKGNPILEAIELNTRATVATLERIEATGGLGGSLGGLRIRDLPGRALDLTGKTLGLAGKGIYHAGKGIQTLYKKVDPIPKVYKAGKEVLGLGGKLAGGTIGLAGKAVMGAVGLGRSAASNLLKFAKNRDLYLEGREDPVITKQKLDDGEYQDEEGNVINNLSSLSKLKGKLYDKDKNVVILNKDVDKLYDVEGKSLKGGILSTGAMGFIGRGAKAAVKMPGKIISGTLGGTWSKIKKATGYINSKLATPKDLYLEGRDEPVIRAVLMLEGKYFDETGKPIMDLNDLKELTTDLYDDKGNIVLTKEEHALGLMDIDGNRLDTMLTSVKQGAFGIAARGINRVTNTTRAIKNLFTGKTSLKDSVGALYKKGKDKASELFDLGKEKLGKLSERFGLKDKMKSIGAAGADLLSGIKNKTSGLFKGMGGLRGETNKILYMILDSIREGFKLDKGLGASSRGPGFLAPMSAYGQESVNTGGLVDVNGRPLYTGGGGIRSVTDSLRAGRDTFNRAKDVFMGKTSGIRAKGSKYLGKAKDKVLNTKTANKVLGNKTLSKAGGFLKSTAGKLRSAAGLGLSLLGGLLGSSQGAQAAPEESQEQQPMPEPKDKLLTATKSMVDPNNVTWNDRDGSGRRDGAWQDRYELQEERRKQKMEIDNRVQHDVKYKNGPGVGGAISDIVGIVGNAFSLLTSGAGAIFKGIKGALGKGGWLRKLAGGVFSKLAKVPMVGKAITAAKGLAGSAIAKGGALVKGLGSMAAIKSTAATALAAGSSAVSAATTAVASAGSAILGFLSAPIVLGGLAVTAVGVGAYYLYKYLKGKPEKIDEIRLAQYGFPSEVKHLKKQRNQVFALEMYLLDGRVEYSDGRAKVLSTAVKEEDMLDLFKIDKADEETKKRFNLWMQYRFLPFFLTSLSAYKKVTGKLDLHKAYKLKKEEKREFLELSSFKDGPYKVDSNPFPNGSPLPDTQILAEQLIAKEIGVETAGSAIGKLAAQEIIAKTIKENEKEEEAAKAKEADQQKKDKHAMDILNKEKDIAIERRIKAQEERAKAIHKTYESAGIAQAVNNANNNTPALDHPDNEPRPTGDTGGTLGAITGAAMAAGVNSGSNVATPPIASTAGANSISPTNATGAPDKPSGGLTAASGPIVDPSGAEKYIKFHDGAKLAGANPAMLKNFYSMVKEYGESTGKKVQVNSGYRSIEEQKAIRKRDKTAARPGGSLHNFGLAIDINTVDANAMEKLGLMRKYGFTRPIGKETWHIEPAGIQSDINRAKKDVAWATQMTHLSLGRGGGGMALKSNRVERNRKYAMELFMQEPMEIPNDTTPTVNHSVEEGGAPPGEAMVNTMPDVTANTAPTANRIGLNHSELVTPDKVTGGNLSNTGDTSSILPITGANSDFNMGTMTAANDASSLFPLTSAGGNDTKQSANKLGTAPSASTGIEMAKQTTSLDNDKLNNVSPDAEPEPVGNVTTDSESDSGTPDNWTTRQGIIKAITKYSKKVGISPEIMVLTAIKESSLRPYAQNYNQNGTKGATGLFQFMPSTWNEQLGKHGKKYNLPPDTQPTDPKASTLLAGEYYKSNLSGLKKIVPNPGPVEAYFTHFLGPGGARTFFRNYQKDSNTLGTTVLPAAAANNPPSFFADPKTKQTPLTLSQVYNKIKREMYKNAADMGYNVSDGSVSDLGPKIDTSSGNPPPSASNNSGSMAGSTGPESNVGNASSPGTYNDPRQMLIRDQTAAFSGNAIQPELGDSNGAMSNPVIDSVSNSPMGVSNVQDMNNISGREANAYTSPVFEQQLEAQMKSVATLEQIRDLLKEHLTSNPIGSYNNTNPIQQVSEGKSSNIVTPNIRQPSRVITSMSEPALNLKRATA